MVKNRSQRSRVRAPLLTLWFLANFVLVTGRPAIHRLFLQVASHRPVRNLPAIKIFGGLFHSLLFFLIFFLSWRLQVSPSNIAISCSFKDYRLVVSLQVFSQFWKIKLFLWVTVCILLQAVSLSKYQAPGQVWSIASPSPLLQISINDKHQWTIEHLWIPPNISARLWTSLNISEKSQQLRTTLNNN